MLNIKYKFKMTRHARNCTAGAVYTYNEKKRDAAESGYGTNNQRLVGIKQKAYLSVVQKLQIFKNQFNDIHYPH